MENNYLSMTWAIEITAFILIVVISFLIFQIRKISSNLQDINSKLIHKLDNKSKDDNFFNSENAEIWFEKGEIKKLKEYCEKFIKETPNSVQANWYYALSQYNQGYYELARIYFEKVITLNPLWRDGAIIYLQEIDNKINNRAGETLH